MPELRKDPLVGRWVVFSPERKQRPQDFGANGNPIPPIDAFAWGNEHLTPSEVFAIRPPPSAANTPGWEVRVVPNAFPALRIEGELQHEAAGIYDRMNGIGAHEVIIETHDTALPLEEQTVDGVTKVLTAYRTRIQDLRKDSRFRYILIFKNVGPLAGASLRHPHSQLIALPIVPRTVRDKLDAARRHYLEKERNIFEDILRFEQKEGARIVYENNGFAAFCPYASRFPFEICLMPKRQNAHYHQAEDHELALAADALRVVLKKLNKGVGRPDYNLILHTAPLAEPLDMPDGNVAADFRWHLEILPRMAGIAGFEFGTGFFINSTLPEEAAQFLRSVKVEA